jgi:hypothetical protein
MENKLKKKFKSKTNKVQIVVSNTDGTPLDSGTKSACMRLDLSIVGINNADDFISWLENKL